MLHLHSTFILRTQWMHWFGTYLIEIQNSIYYFKKYCLFHISHYFQQWQMTISGDYLGKIEIAFLEDCSDIMLYKLI